MDAPQALDNNDERKCRMIGMANLQEGAHVKYTAAPSGRVEHVTMHFRETEPEARLWARVLRVTIEDAVSRSAYFKKIARNDLAAGVHVPIVLALGLDLDAFNQELAAMHPVLKPILAGNSRRARSQVPAWLRKCPM